MRWTLALSLALSGCQPEASDDCEDVSAEAPATARPPALSREGPIVVGETLPVYRIMRREWTADEFAGAALLLACALRDGGLEATDALDVWAEEASAIEDDSVFAAPFSDRSIVVELDAFGDRTIAASVGQGESALADAAIGSDAALAAARTALDRLESFGMTADAFDRTPLHSGAVMGHVFDGETMESWTFVEWYFMHFGVSRGGIDVLGPSLEVDVSATGELVRLSWHHLDVEEAGSGVAELDAALADARLRELVIDAAGLGEGTEAQFGAGRPAYVLASGETDGESGPRWVNEYYFVSANGGVSFAEIAAVSMTDAESPLVPIAP